MRNGAPLAAIVGPFLQLASRAGVHVGKLNAVLVGPRPALLCAANTPCCACPRCVFGAASDKTAAVYGIVRYCCHLCSQLMVTRTGVPWDLESPTYPEDLRQWQVARAKTRREAMPA